MKQCHLRNPLVSSLVMLVALSILLGLMLSSGGFFAGIWAFIVMIFRAIQLFIALSIGIIVCFALLIALFLAAVAGHSDKATALKKFEGVRTKLLGWVDQARDICPYRRGKKLASGQDKSSIGSEFMEVAGDAQEEVSEEIKATGGDIAAAWEEFEEKTDNLHTQIQTVQSSIITTEHVRETVTSEVNPVREALELADAGLKELHTRVLDIAGKVAAIKPDDIIGDIPSRLGKLEKLEIPAPVDLQPVQTQLVALQAEVADLEASKGQIAVLQGEVLSLKKALAEAFPKDESAQSAPPESQNKKEDDEHRLLSYYEDSPDKQKISDLVIQTLKKDMTYAQIMDFLIEEMGREGGKVISEHPSLAKDYIRQCRRNS